MTLSYFIHLDRKVMECSWFPLSPFGRSTGAWSSRAMHPSTPPHLLSLHGRAGTACTLPPSLARDIAISSRMNHEQKPNKSYVRSFLLPPQLSCPVSYSWQFIPQEFSHLRFQWLMWWTFYPFPGKSLARSSTPPCHFPRGSHSCCISPALD